MSLDRFTNRIPNLTGDATKDIEALRTALFDILRVRDKPTGLWTPTDASGAALTLTTPLGIYVRITDSLVFVSASFTYPVTASGAQAVIGGLPITPRAGNANRTGTLSYTASANAAKWLLDGGAKTGSFFTAAGAGVTNANMSATFNCINAIYAA